MLPASVGLVNDPARYLRLMLNLISVIVGVVALLFGIVAFIPLLAWGYWLIVPLALLGLLFGVLSEKNTGRNLNLIVVVVGIIRLLIGGGIV